MTMVYNRHDPPNINYKDNNNNNLVQELTQAMLMRDKVLLVESRHRSLLSLQITITLTESALLIFFIWGWKLAGIDERGLNPQP